MSAKITNEMKSNCIGEFSFKTEEPCPRCLLKLDRIHDDIECLCDDSDDRMYFKNHIVPWDTCKEIYKRMASDDPRLSDDPLIALAAVMRGRNITVELDCDDDSALITLKAGSDEVYCLGRFPSGGHIDASDIKPESE